MIDDNGGGGGGGRWLTCSSFSVHLRARGEDERCHRSRDADVDRHHLRSNVLHGVVHGEPGDDGAPGAVHVQIDGLGAVLGV